MTRAVHAIDGLHALLVLIAGLPAASRARLFADLELAADGLARQPLLVRLLTRVNNLDWTDDDKGEGRLDFLPPKGNAPIFSVAVGRAK